MSTSSASGRALPHVRRPAVWLGTVWSVHFTVSTALWGCGVALAIGQRFSRDEWLSQIVFPALPCAALFALSVVCLILALRRTRFTIFALAVLFVATAMAFGYDISHERWQMSTDVAAVEYWDEGGRAHTYLTWWWYNDRWIE